MDSRLTSPTGALRADARRNRQRLLEIAHEAFVENGVSASMDDIARRAGVGIGTLYRHFPNRQALLEALYVDEVEEVCRSAAALFSGRLHRRIRRLFQYWAFQST